MVDFSFVRKNQDQRTISSGYFTNIKQLAIFIKELAKDPIVR
jgi:hypothetical protein